MISQTTSRISRASRPRLHPRQRHLARHRPLASRPGTPAPGTAARRRTTIATPSPDRASVSRSASCCGSRTARLGLDDRRLLGLDELQEVERPLHPPGPRVQPVDDQPRVEPAEALLAREPPHEAADVVGQVVVDRELVPEGPERDQHLEVADDGGRHRQLLDADRLEDVDGELRVRVLAVLAPIGPGAARVTRGAIGRGVVQERLVQADQLPAGVVDVGRGEGASQRMSSRTAASISPRNSSQL